MDFDFALVLVLLAVVTGVIWLLDVVRWAPRRRARLGDDAPLPVVVDYARSFFPLILLVLVLRSFVGEPFRIPSGSMLPTLEVGDFIFVNKAAYGLRLPVVNYRIFATGTPERGDVAVFRYPPDPSVDFIKRVIGLPGDLVQYRNKRLYINGEEVPQDSLGAYAEYPVQLVERRLEILGGEGHEMLVMPGRNSPDLEFRVPEGQYFVMGDNRDNSNDSREWGMVPEENLVGRAVMVWMSWAPERGPVWSRIGTRIE